MKHEYRPRGVCSTKIEFDIGEDNKVSGIKFKDGCDGNLKAVAILSDGMDAAELAARLKGVRCGRKKSSCADQFAQAIEQATGI